MKRLVGNKRLSKVFALSFLLTLALVLIQVSARADTNPQPPPISQNWSDASLIATNNDWSRVPGIIGYRGDDMTAVDGVDPATITADGSSTPVDVNANKTNPDAFNTGGITEFEITNPVVALQGSGTANAPHLLLSLNTTNRKNVNVAYNLRDIDSSKDDAVQPMALQYRIGNTGSYTNIPAGYVADATTGPNQATKVTPVNTTLPAAADNKSLVQVRVITTNAVGSDEWTGVDDIGVTSAPFNTAPTANNNTYSMNEDGTLSVNTPGVLGNDTDPDGNTLTAALVSGPNSGTLTLNNDGSFNYRPNANFNGTDTFTYRASDGQAASNTTTVTINVAAVNDAPNAAADTASTSEDTPANINVLSNDSDAEGNSLTVTSFTQAQNGSVSRNSDGTLRYAPNANFNGVDTFTYTVSDGSGAGGTSTGTVTITVGPANDAPAANDDTYNVNEDGTLTRNAPGVLSNDTDPENDALTARLSRGPASGALNLNTDGSFTYTPGKNYNGGDSFTYQACDNGTPSICSEPATVTINVAAVNDPPVAVDDSASTDEDNPVTKNVISNDNDIEGNNLTVTNATQPRNGRVQCSGGECAYTPNQNFNGADSFDYTVSDGNGGTDTGTVTVNVRPVNDAPVAGNDAAQTDEDEPLTIPAPGVLGNDTDADGDTLTAEIVDGPAHGRLTFNANGSFNYTPDVNYSGPDSFTYRANDGTASSGPVTVDLTVNPVNDAPDAKDDSFSVTEDDILSVAAPGVLRNDTDLEGDQLSAELVNGPRNGTLTLNANGSFDYTPDANYSGTDTFTYRTSDGNGGNDTATVALDVSAVNDAPNVVNDSADTDEDNPAIIGVKANDSAGPGEPDQTLEITSVTDPANGAAEVIAGDPNAGKVRYTPDENFNGTDSFEYTVCDSGNPRECATAAVTVTVNPVNDRPVSKNDTGDSVEDNAMNVDVLANDSDADGNDTLDPSSVRIVSEPANGTAAANPDGTVTYTPNPDYNGSDTFEYTVCDNAEPRECSEPATVTMIVEAVNDAPNAGDDERNVAEDGTLAFPADELLANDSAGPNEPGQALSVTEAVNAKGGSVSLENGQVTFAPDADYNGPASFTYTACDDGEPGKCSQATVNVNVTSVNDAPDARDGERAIDEDQALTVEAPGVLTNDSDRDGDNLIAAVEEGPRNGTLNLNGDGSFTYTPDENFNGEDSFIYRISDGNGGTDTATTRITVRAVNDAPTPADDQATVNEDSPVDINVLDNDADPDGDALSVTDFTQPQNGTVSLDQDGSFTYTPARDYNGPDTFTYRVSDGKGGNVTARVSLTVNGSNDAPRALADSYDTGEDQSLSIDAPGVLGNDTDAEDDSLSAELVSGPQNGTLNLNPDGSFTYNPNANFNGTDTFTYRVSDGNGGTDTVTDRISVGAANDAPEPQADTATASEDTPIDVNVLSNDTDPEGDTLRISDFTQPRFGTVDCTPEGVCTYTPNADFNGTDTFTYTVSDGVGGESGTTVTVTITAVNDALVARDGDLATNEDEQLVVEAPGVLGNDTDVDGDPLTAAVEQGPRNGELSLNPDGSFTYTPEENFNGDDSFTYRASDGNGGSDVGEVRIAVRPVNDAPDAANDTAETQEDTPAEIDVLANDRDIDGDALSVTDFTQPENGTVDCAESGVCTYRPNADFNGTDTFTYTTSGNKGTDTAEVSVTVGPFNDAPRASDDEKAVAEDDTLTFPASELTANDSTGPNEVEQSLSVTEVSGANGGTVTLDDGQITFEPEANYAGPAGFTYTTCDDGDPQECAQGTVNVNVTAVNDAPENTVPGAQSTDDTAALVFSSTDENGISVSDDSGAGGEARVTLSVTEGALSLGGADGLTFSEGDGADDETMTFTGSISAINAALESLRYEPGGYNGAATLRITTDDLGNTGTGGPRSDEDAVDIAVNDTTAPDTPVADLASDSDTGRSGTDDVTSDATPTFSGTAEPGSTVRLYDGETLLAEITADENGDWTFTLPDALSDGGHQITATATDAAGNVSDRSEPVGITVDTAAPDTIIEQSPPSPTNQRDTARFFSSSEEGATFECGFDGGAFEPCDSPKEYNNLSDGSHTFVVRSVDAAGNTDESPASRTFVVDTTPPSITLASPEDSALLRGEISLSANASDENGIENVEFVVDGRVVDSDMSAPYSTTFDTNSLLDGQHTIAVRAYDEAGNVTESGTRTIRVDNTAPDTIIDRSPASPTNATTARFEFGSTEANSTFECSIDGGAYEPCQPSKEYTDLPDGAHTFRVRAVDAAGNVDESFAERRFTVDTQAPDAPAITSPTEGSIDNDGNFTVSGTAEPGSRVELLENGEIVDKAITNPNGNWSISLIRVGDGGHAYTARATDAAGNTSATSGGRTINVDTGAPEVSGVTPAEEATGVPTNTTVRVVVSEPVDESTLYGFYLTNEATGERVSASKSYDPATGEITLTPNANLDFESVYTATVKGGPNGIKDRAGNPLVQDRTWSFTTAQAPDTGAPDAPAVDLVVGSDTGSSDTDNVTNDTTPAITGAAEPNSMVEIFVDGNSMGRERADAQGNYSFTLPDALSEGRHEITATAADAAGNVSNRSEPLNITVDTGAPDTNVTKSPSSPTNNTTTSFEFTSDEEGASFECRLDDGAWEPCSSPNEYTDLSDGEHTFEVRSVDAAGNEDTSPTSRTFVVDTEKPGVEITTPQEGELVRDEVTIGATASDNIGIENVEFVVDGERVDSDMSAPYASTFDTNSLPDGQHTIMVLAYDEAGNVAESGRRTVRVDNTAPETTVRRSPDDLTNDRTASFEFDSTEENSAFECSIDGGEYGPCESGKEYRELADGKHTFWVRSVDEAGNVDPSPAERQFTIDAGVPGAPEILSPATDLADNDGNFTISGIAEPDSRVRLYEGGTLVGEAAADEAGNWSVDLRNVTDGAHTYHATATDKAGNESENSAGREVRVDSQTPDAPSVDLESASDTGRSDTDDLTRDAKPTFSGKAEPGSRVKLHEGGTLLGTATANQNGGYKISLTEPLSEGTHEVTATATDEAGHVSDPSGALRIVVDRTVDTSIDAGPSGTHASRSASFEFSSPENGAGFECSIDGGAFRACSSPKKYRNLSEGEHTFRVRATDAAGNTDESPAEVTFTVDLPEPKADLSVRVGAPEQITQGNRFSYTLTVSNRGPDEARNTVLTSKLPRGMSFVSAPEGCKFNKQNRTITCRLGDLGVNGTRKVKITARAERSGGFGLRGGVSSSTSDPRSANSGGTDKLSVRKKPEPPRANLAIRVDSPARITRGESFPYTITVANLGPDRAENAIVESVLPRSVSFVRAPENCRYDRGERAITCRLGDLPDGSRRRLEITVRADRVGEADFRASVESGTPDPIRSNDRDVD